MLFFFPSYIYTNSKKCRYVQESSKVIAYSYELQNVMDPSLLLTLSNLIHNITPITAELAKSIRNTFSSRNLGNGTNDVVHNAALSFVMKGKPNCQY
jgi:hypothetical protein